MYNEHTNLLKLLKCDDFFYLLLRGLLILNIYSHTTYLLGRARRGLVVVSLIALILMVDIGYGYD
jgi:hypothetical protein